MSLRPSSVTVAAAVVSLAVGFLAGSVPKNSVGSPQIKNAQVKSVDLQDGGVTTTDVKDGSLTTTDVQDGSLTSADLAAGTLPAEVFLAATSNSISGCGGSGWCYLPSSGASPRVVAQFETPPANSSGWQSTGQISVSVPTRINYTATANVWFFGTSNLDIMCSVRNGASNLASSGWVRSDGNQSQTVTVTGSTVLAAGDHLIRYMCYGTGVDMSAATNAAINITGIPTS